jgi:hypothetical protein
MAPTCFGAITPSSGSALLVLARITDNEIPEDGVIAPKYFRTILMLILIFF